MPSKHVPTISTAKPLGPYSPVVIANGFIFISGQAPLKPGGQTGEWAGPSVTDQTRQCLQNIEMILKSLHSSLKDIVKVTVYLWNPSDYRTMNEAYKEFFPSEPPARSVARLGGEVPGLLVSIDAIAVQPER